LHQLNPTLHQHIKLANKTTSTAKIVENATLTAKTNVFVSVLVIIMGQNAKMKLMHCTSRLFMHSVAQLVFFFWLSV